MALILYTQPKCPYCDVIKDVLNDTGYTYVTIDIKETPEGKSFLKSKGHKTVPQLYWNDYHINTIPTKELTTHWIYDKISAVTKDERKNRL